MLRSKKTDVCCVLAMAVALALAVGLWGIVEEKPSAAQAQPYESLLFDATRVHCVDIAMADWDAMIANAAMETYYECDVTIDGERYAHAAIRTKGNTSLSTVAQLGSERYSFKIEFDHFNEAATYHGLDKLNLNNLIQDATMMKDYLAYTLMRQMDVPAPLCSYVQLTVNGEPWGLYLAVEGVEESFLARNGMTRGELYKPDSMSMGMAGDAEAPEEAGFAWQPAGFGQNNDDVKLIDSGDSPENYPNIFNNAKTPVTRADQERLVASLRRLNAGEDLAETVDQEEVIRYLAAHHFLCNDDSYTGMMVHNYYLYEEQGRLSIIPWDYNLAFGGFSAGNDATSDVNAPMDSPVSGGTTASRPLIAWIFEDQESLDAYHAVYGELLAFCRTGDALAQEIDRVAELIRPFVEADPTAFYSPEEFRKGVDTLKRFCERRIQSLQGQLDGTVPATSQEQWDNREMLVDASDISTRDMGYMETASAPGQAGPGGAFPDMPSFDAAEAPDRQPEDGMTPSGGESANFSASGGEQAAELFFGSAGNAAEGEAAGDAFPEAGYVSNAPLVWRQTEGEQGAAFVWFLTLGCILALLLALLLVRRADAHNR